MLFLSLLESPQQLPDGTAFSSDQVIDLLYRETVALSMQAGVQPAPGYLPTRFGETASLRVCVRRERVARGLELLRHLLLHSVFTEERVAAVVHRLQKLLEDAVHDDGSIALLLLRRQLFRSEASFNCLDVV